MFTIFYYLRFNVTEYETVEVRHRDAAQIVWDALSLHYPMKSTRP